EWFYWKKKEGVINANILRTESHVINKNHRLYSYCDDMCFKSKNLYNRANYILRQDFINKKPITPVYQLNKEMKDEDVYKVLPAKTAQQINIQLNNNWKSFFSSIKDWSKNKS